MKRSSLCLAAWMLVVGSAVAEDATIPLPPGSNIPAAALNAGEAPRWNPQAAATAAPIQTAPTQGGPAQVMPAQTIPALPAAIQATGQAVPGATVFGQSPPAQTIPNPQAAPQIIQLPTNSAVPGAVVGVPPATIQATAPPASRPVASAMSLPSVM